MLNFTRMLRWSIPVVCTLFFTATSFAQQMPTVAFTGPILRAPLEIPRGTCLVDLHQLEAGNTYSVIASGAAEGQKVTLELSDPAGPAQRMRDRKNTLVFTTTDQHKTIRVFSETPENATTLPIFLSIKCEAARRTTAGWKNLPKKHRHPTLASTLG
ncbi:MAG: hypothetical protein IPL65_14840 [Lewinellaceae bacterium]|nr:hypothetical protein [Lewinellaceae bacterium]